MGTCRFKANRSAFGQDGTPFGVALLALGCAQLSLGSALLSLASALLALGSALLALGSALLSLGSALLALGSALLTFGAAHLPVGASPTALGASRKLSGAAIGPDRHPRVSPGNARSSMKDSSARCDQSVRAHGKQPLVASLLTDAATGNIAAIVSEEERVGHKVAPAEEDDLPGSNPDPVPPRARARGQDGDEIGGAASSTMFAFCSRHRIEQQAPIIRRDGAGSRRNSRVPSARRTIETWCGPTPHHHSPQSTPDPRFPAPRFRA